MKKLIFAALILTTLSAYSQTDTSKQVNIFMLDRDTSYHEIAAVNVGSSFRNWKPETDTMFLLYYDLIWKGTLPDLLKILNSKK